MRAFGSCLASLVAGGTEARQWGQSKKMQGQTSCPQNFFGLTPASGDWQKYFDRQLVFLSVIASHCLNSGSHHQPGKDQLSKTVNAKLFHVFDDCSVPCCLAYLFTIRMRIPNIPLVLTSSWAFVLCPPTCLVNFATTTGLVAVHVDC
jgi:hypothetical protein